MHSQNHEIWIDALDFTDRGGWMEETQFVHLMGAAQLIAAGVPGVPVADANVSIDIPADGTYRVWVRDKNWYKEPAPGRFTVLVDGKGNGKELGALPSERWCWEIAGDYELKAGPHAVSLHDLTGYFARCAAVLITDDMDYLPSPEIAVFQKERARIKGMDTTVACGGDYDIIVAGGGPAGVPAAIAAARMGSRVLLIQDRTMLGGNGSTEIGITFDGASVRHINARETGIAEEIRRLRDRETTQVGDWTRSMETLAAAEKNLTVVYSSHVCGAETDGDRIRSVTAMNILTLAKTRYTAKIFLDCTGDGWLGYYAGAKMRYGRESSAQHGESFAPPVPDTMTMSGCLKSGNVSHFLDSDVPVEYHAPEWVRTFPANDLEFGRKIDGPGRSLMWWLEARNDLDDMWEMEEARDELLKIALAYLNHIKNNWSHKELAQNMLFRFAGVFIGRRETRRLIGDYILTQDDCVSGRDFPDTVAYSGWAIDVHNPKGVYAGDESCMYCIKPVPLVRIPYRCLYSKNIDNLLFAGRNISTTHIALGTVRVENTIATMGQAAGTAAALCIRRNELPRGIYERYLDELQQTLLKNDQFIPGVANHDPGDPCLAAKATASSVCTTEMYESLKGKTAELVPLPCCMTGDVHRSDGDITQLWLKLHSSRTEPVPVTLHVRAGGWSISDFSPFGEEITAQALVPPQCESWVRFPIHVPIKKNELMDPCLLRIWVDGAEGVSWRSVSDLSFHETAGTIDANGKWHTRADHSYRIEREKPEERLADCGPENVVNGWSRILDADRYEWVSDPAQKLPQWLELAFAQPEKIDSISLTFDTDLSNPGTCWGIRNPAPERCVRDYELEIFDGKAWRRIASVQGNFMRKCTHRFEAATVEKLRVTVLATNGDPSARIMEVRAALEG